MAWPRGVNVNNINIARASTMSSAPRISAQEYRWSSSSTPLARAWLTNTQPAQVHENARLQGLLGRHGQLAPAGIAARKQRRDAMRERPHVQGHHSHRRSLRHRHGGNECIGCPSKNAEGLFARLRQLETGIERNAGLEHRRI